MVSRFCHRFLFLFKTGRTRGSFFYFFPFLWGLTSLGGAYRVIIHPIGWVISVPFERLWVMSPEIVRQRAGGPAYL